MCKFLPGLSKSESCCNRHSCPNRTTFVHEIRDESRGIVFDSSGDNCCFILSVRLSACLSNMTVYLSICVPLFPFPYILVGFGFYWKGKSFFIIPRYISEDVPEITESLLPSLTFYTNTLM